MRDWPDSTVRSWIELQQAIDAAAGCVFRGQGNREWPLVSSFRRLVPSADDADALILERNTLLQFRSQAHLYLHPSVMPPDMFKLTALDTYLEWLMLMQHYGAPTRLLDWTYSPYVALYFAVIDPKADAAVWYFNHQPAVAALLERHNRKLNEYFDYADLSSDEIRVTNGTPLLYAAEKKMRSAREVAQQGLFTFTNRLMADHQDAIAQTGEERRFGRIIVPADLKREFTVRLASMNVTAAALFPGVEGICASIRDYLRLSAPA